MSFTGNENHDIDLNDAAKMTKDYRIANPGEILGGFFGKDAIEAILAQEGCVGIRYYHALTEDGKRTIVLVGAKEDQNDIVDGKIADYTVPDPPGSSLPNPLNS